MKPYLNERKCPAQEQVCLAIPACTRGAIFYLADATLPLGGQIVFEMEKCDGCGDCAKACCGNAIELR
jgi:flavoprotein